MFRMCFDQKVVKNVEEHSLFAFMHAHVSSLHMQPVFMLCILDSYVRSLFLCVCVRILQFPWTYDLTCVRMSLRMHMRTCVQMLTLINPYLTILASFSLVFSSDYHSNVLFLVYRSRLHSWVGEAPTALLHDIGP